MAAANAAVAAATATAPGGPDAAPPPPSPSPAWPSTFGHRLDRDHAPRPAERAEPAALREPRPFLPPNVTRPGPAPAASGAASGDAGAPRSVAMPPPLAAQPFSGPVVQIGEPDDRSLDGPDAGDTEGESAGSDATAHLATVPAEGDTPGPAAPDLAAAGADAPGAGALPRRGASPSAATGAASTGADLPATEPVGAGTKPPAPPILPPRRRLRDLAGPREPSTPAAPPVMPTGPVTPAGPLTMSPDAPFPLAAPPPPAPAGGPVTPSLTPATPAAFQGTVTPLPPLIPGAAAPAPTQAPTSPVEPARTGSGLRVADGLLVGAASAAAAGTLWWLVVALTQRQFVYLALLLGAGVGYGVLTGARKGTPALGAVAALLTLVSLSLAQYFIERSLAISELGLDLVLWEGAGHAFEVIKATYRDDKVALVFVLLATAVAGLVAGRPGNRPAR